MSKRYKWSIFFLETRNICSKLFFFNVCGYRLYSSPHQTFEVCADPANRGGPHCPMFWFGKRFKVYIIILPRSHECFTTYLIIIIFILKITLSNKYSKFFLSSSILFAVRREIRSQALDFRKLCEQFVTCSCVFPFSICGIVCLLCKLHSCIVCIFEVASIPCIIYLFSQTVT